MYLKTGNILQEGDLYLNAEGNWQPAKFIGGSVKEHEFGRYFRPIDKKLPLSLQTLNWVDAEGYNYWYECKILAAVHVHSNKTNTDYWDIQIVNVEVDDADEYIYCYVNGEHWGWETYQINYFVLLEGVMPEKEIPCEASHEI